MIISGKAITNKNKDIIRLYFSKEQYDEFGWYYIDLPYDFNLFSNIILTQKKQEDETSYRIIFYFDIENKTCKAITPDGQEHQGNYADNGDNNLELYDFYETIDKNNIYTLEIYKATEEARFTLNSLEGIEWARIDLIKEEN